MLALQGDGSIASGGMVDFNGLRLSDPDLMKLALQELVIVMPHTARFFNYPSVFSNNI